MGRGQPDEQGVELKTSGTTEELLESIVLRVVRVINIRDFDSPAWDRMIPAFQGYKATLRPRTSNKEEIKDAFRAAAERDGTHKIRVLSLTTNFDEIRCAATVVMNCDVTGTPGVPNGMGRKLVTIIDFAEVNERWMAVRENSIPGPSLED